MLYLGNINECTVEQIVAYKLSKKLATSNNRALYRMYKGAGLQNKFLANLIVGAIVGLNPDRLNVDLVVQFMLNGLPRMLESNVFTPKKRLVTAFVIDLNKGWQAFYM